MIIYAVNIHTGGGKILLDTLLLNSPFAEVTTLFMDSRYKPPQNATAKKFFISKGRLLGRLLTEFRLHRFLKNNPNEQVLFFGNIPPLIKVKNPSALFLQNCFLTRQMPLPRDTRKEFIRNWVESVLLKFFHKNVNEVWVQTAWMKEITQRFLKQTPIHIKPVFPILAPAKNNSERVFSFIYVGSLSLNKRLNFFLEALSKLDSQLTKEIAVAIVLDHPLDVQTEITDKWGKFKNIRLNFYNKLCRDNLSDLYEKSVTFVATSRYESFCLPIYEAHHYGCKLIVPKAGYTENLTFESSQYNLDSVEDLTSNLKQLV